MTWQLLHSEFPYKGGHFYFFFISAADSLATADDTFYIHVQYQKQYTGGSSVDRPPQGSGKQPAS